MNQQQRQRNGKIEFFRFFFCIIIVLYHINLHWYDLDVMIGKKITLAQNGYFGTEFFFLVSGYLMARSAWKTQNNGVRLDRGTVCFIGKKLCSILPFHLLAFALTYGGAVWLHGDGFSEAIDRLAVALPNLLFLQRSGIRNEELLGIEWYISAMLFAMVLLYPLCKKYYHMTTRVITPILAVTLVGYLCHYDYCISDIDAWMGVLPKPYLRGLAEIALGVFGFEVARQIQRVSWKIGGKIGWTVLELTGYGLCIYYIFSDLPGWYEPYFLFAMWVAVLLSFSGVTYFGSLFQNKAVFFLGKITLPIYLSQTFTRQVFKVLLPDTMATGLRITAVTCIAMAIGIALYCIGQPILHWMKRKTDGWLTP